MKRIAICLTGTVTKIRSGWLLTEEDLYKSSDYPYANFIACYNAVKQHILIPNNDCVIDFFIHCWATDLSEDLCKLYNPKLSIFEDNKQYAEDIKKRMISPEKYGYVSWALSIKKGLELVHQYEKENGNYDLIMLYRPDLLIMKNINFKNYDNTVITHLGDFYFIMSSENSRLFTGLYDSSLIGNIPRPHYWIDNFIVNYMHRKLVIDTSVIVGKEIEVVRKIYRHCVLEHGVPVDYFQKYGISVDEVKLCTI